MIGRWTSLASSLAGLALLAAASLVPGVAAAAGCNCTPPSAPPPCCKPPSAPPPPSQPCCGSGGHQITVPGVNVTVGASVVVNASAAATINAGGSAGGSVTVFGGGGGSSFSMGSGPVSVIQGLNVEGLGARSQRTAYNASRTRIRTVVIQAFCLDDRATPHPASQVTPDREINELYEGELYRCLAGTRMQYTLADYDGHVSFDHGQTVTCAKGDALYFSGSAGGAAEGSGRAGKLECRPQKAARDCNERSLLRRFGAGVKILKVMITETYTAYREETMQSSQVSTFNMTVDGGVGGIAF